MNAIWALLLTLSVSYGAFISWKYWELKNDLHVYQRGALSVLSRLAEESNADPVDRRMRDLGLLSAPNDPAARNGPHSARYE